MLKWFLLFFLLTCAMLLPAYASQQVPINGDTMMAGGMVAAAVVYIKTIESTLKKDLNEAFVSIDKSLDKLSKQINALDKQMALDAQKNTSSFVKIKDDSSSVVDAIVQLKERVTTLEMQTRDLINWTNTKGADFHGRTNWKTKKD